MMKRFMDGKTTVAEILDRLEREFDEGGLDALSPRRLGTYARPRRQEVAAALNRLRTLRIEQIG